MHSCPHRVTQFVLAGVKPVIDMTDPNFGKPSTSGVRPWIIRLLLIPATCLTLLSAAQGATADAAVVREYIELEERARFDSLLAEFGRNKNLPLGYELQTLLALSHYPELKEVRVQFVLDDVSIPLSSRPHWTSMLRSSRKRTYQVIMDTNLEGPRAALLLKNQPFNAQVGIIGHELAHTVYYLDRSFFGIVSDALCQLNGCRIDFERNTDRRLIDYGLGWQRYDHARFLRARFGGSEAAAMNMQGGGGAYMSPAELLKIIDNHPIYAN